MISWPLLLVQKMTRTISKDQQESVCYVFQRGYVHGEIARVLNVGVGSVHNIRKKHLHNVNCLRGGRP